MFQPTEPLAFAKADQQQDLSTSNSPINSEDIEPIALVIDESPATRVKPSDESQSTLPSFFTELLPSDLLLSMVDYFIVDKPEKSFSYYSNFIDDAATALVNDNPDDKLNTTQNTLNALFMLSYKKLPPASQLELITKAFAKLCRAYIKQLHHKKITSITDKQFLELILPLEIYQNNFEKIPVITYVVATNNIQFIDAICTSLIETLYVQNLIISKDNLYSSKELNAIFKSWHDDFIIKDAKLLAVTLEEGNAVFMHWILKNIYIYEIHYLTEYLYKTKDSKKLQKFSDDILYNYRSHALNPRTADNSKTTKPDGNNQITTDTGKRVFQRIRNTIMALNFRIIYVDSSGNPIESKAIDKNPKYQFYAQYAIINSYADCKNAVDFIFSLPSDVYTPELKLVDILLTFIAYADNMRRDLIEYAITSYQSLPQSLPLHQFIDFDILDSILLIYMDKEKQYDESRVIFYSNIVNEYFKIKNLNNYTSQILKTIIFAATYESECGQLFLRDARLSSWFENNYTTHHSDLYLVAASMRNSFAMVSTLLDLQRHNNDFNIDWINYIDALRVALQKNHTIVCNLLLDSMDSYFSNYVSLNTYSRGVRELEDLIFDAISLKRYEFVDRLISFTHVFRTYFSQDLVRYLILSAAYKHEPAVIFYFLDKMHHSLDFLIAKFKDIPLIQLIFKLHKFLIKEPSFFNRSSLFAYNELNECIRYIVSQLNTSDIETTLIPYLTAVFADRFTIVKQNLDKLTQTLLTNNELRKDISFTFIFLKIIEYKYPTLAKEYGQKFLEVNVEKMQAHLNKSNYVRLKQLIPHLLKANTPEQTKQLLNLLANFSTFSKRDVPKYRLTKEMQNWLLYKINCHFIRNNDSNKLDKKYLDMLQESFHHSFHKAYLHDAHESDDLSIRPNDSVLRLGEAEASLQDTDEIDDRAIRPIDSVLTISSGDAPETIASIAQSILKSSTAEPESFTDSDIDSEESDQELDYSTKLRR